MKSFALDLKTSDLSNEGSLEFNGVDDTKFAGPLATAPLNNTDGHWSVDNVDFSVGNQRIKTDSNFILGAYPLSLSIPSYFNLTCRFFRPRDRLRRRTQRHRPRTGRGSLLQPSPRGVP